MNLLSRPVWTIGLLIRDPSINHHFRYRPEAQQIVPRNRQCLQDIKEGITATMLHWKTYFDRPKVDPHPTPARARGATQKAQAFNQILQADKHQDLARSGGVKLVQRVSRRSCNSPGTFAKSKVVEARIDARVIRLGEPNRASVVYSTGLHVYMKRRTSRVGLEIPA